MGSTLRFPSITRDEVFRIETRSLWLRWPRAEDLVAMASFFSDASAPTKAAEQISAMRAAGSAQKPILL